ncbi:cutinase family protein, partial [Rhodococcus hoagii]|nr:cutinase family protein [Prescottella equi]
MPRPVRARSAGHDGDVARCTGEGGNGDARHGHVADAQPARELGASVDRAYVPYPGSFGGITPGGTDSYAVVGREGGENLTQAATTVLAKCPKTKLAVVGFSQGSHAASNSSGRWGKGIGAVACLGNCSGRSVRRAPPQR